MRVVFTGGPGVGKTTVLDLLGKQRYAVGRDAARDIIRERKAQGLSPRPEATVFATQILEREIAAYQTTSTTPVFFERGVVEAAGSLFSAGALTESECNDLIARFRYDQVYIFPPWEAIYCNDEERDHDFEHVVRVHSSTQAWYERYGYSPLEVPLGTPEQRLDFIMLRIDRASDSLT